MFPKTSQCAGTRRWPGNVHRISRLGFRPAGAVGAKPSGPDFRQGPDEQPEASHECCRVGGASGDGAGTAGVEENCRHEPGTGAPLQELYVGAFQLDHSALRIVFQINIEWKLKLSRKKSWNYRLMPRLVLHGVG